MTSILSQCSTIEAEIILDCAILHGVINIVNATAAADVVVISCFDEYYCWNRERTQTRAKMKQRMRNEMRYTW